MASPILYARFEPQLYERVLQAAESEGSSLSVFLRMAVEEKLGTVEREAAERAVLLAEARKFLANPGTDSTDREATGLVERYVAAIEAHAGRISVAEAHGRARWSRWTARSSPSLSSRPDGPLAALELAATPRRRGFLKAALAAERARALLVALPEPSAAPTAAGLLGEARTRELWTQAVSWPGWRRVFCATHGIVPCAPSSDGTRCYLGCTIPTNPEAA